MANQPQHGSDATGCPRARRGGSAPWGSLCALALLWLAPNAFALGLGDISVRSYLGQPLEARIELISRTPEELAEVSASLASADSYRMVGIERLDLSVPLEFKVNTQATPPHVEVRSHAPVKDPILQFVVEVSFANGRILREYTVFLDPPSFAAPVPLPTVTPRPREASPGPRKAPPVLESPEAEAVPSARDVAPAKPEIVEAQTVERRAEPPPRPDREVAVERDRSRVEPALRDPAPAAPQEAMGEVDANALPEAAVSPGTGQDAAQARPDNGVGRDLPDALEAREELAAAEAGEDLAEPEPTAPSASAPAEPVTETADESAVDDPTIEEAAPEPVEEPSDFVEETGQERGDESSDEPVGVPGPTVEAEAPETTPADEEASDVAEAADSAAEDAPEQPPAQQVTEADAGVEQVATASEPPPVAEPSAAEEAGLPATEQFEPEAAEPPGEGAQVDAEEPADVPPVATEPIEAAEPVPEEPSEPRQTRYQVQVEDLQSYGPVQRGETLWGIASDVAAGSAYSINQVMLAIQRYNPEAFSRDNINLLKQGAILRLPPVDEMALLSAREAMLEAMRQADAFADIRAGRQPAERPPVLAAGATVERSRGPEDGSSEAEPEGRLELVPPPSVADSAALGTGAGGEEEGVADAGSEPGAGGRLSEEELASVQAESDYLAEQLKELEAEIAGDGAAVAVEDPGLAELEERLRAERQADEPEPPVAIAPADEGTGVSSRFGWWLVLPLLAVVGLTAWWLHRRAGRASDESRLEAALERDDAMGAVKAISDEAEQILAVLESAPGATDDGQPADTEEAQAGEGGDAPEREDLETLLDLARAHIATGDPEAARVLLQEVVANGDASQVAEAKHMLREI